MNDVSGQCVKVVRVHAQVKKLQHPMSDSFSCAKLQGKAFPSTRHYSFLSLPLQSIYYSMRNQATLIACWQYFPYQSMLSFANK